MLSEPDEICVAAALHFLVLKTHRMSPVEFVFEVPEETARHRGRGTNQEIANFQRRGESGGVF